MQSENTITRLPPYAKIIFKIVLYISLGILLSLLFKKFIIFPTKVHTHFMDPTIKKGSTVYVLTLINREKLNLNDIILIKSNYDSEKVVIARVIGLPSDKIRIKDKKIYRNNALETTSGKYSFSDVRSPFPTSFSNRDNLSELTVAVDSYFVLSDNRDESIDSREFGTISKNHIIGRILFKN